MSNAEAGANTGNQTAENDDDKPITKGALFALLQGFKEEINKSVHSAVSDRAKRLKDQLTKDVEGRLAAIKPTPKADETDEADVDEKADEPKAVERPARDTREEVEKPKPKPQVDPEVAKLRRELASLTAKQRESEQKAIEAERRRAHAEGYQSIKSALVGKAVAGAEDAALDLLKGRGAVHFTEEGVVRLRLGGKDEPEDGLDLEDGIKAFVATQEFKFFAPPPGSGGNSARKQPTPSTMSTTARPLNSGSAHADIAAAFEQQTGTALADLL
jgi:hypothetical protein